MSRLPVFALAKDLRERLRLGHPWIFDRALASSRPRVSPGALVELAYRDEPLGVGYADPDSPIAVRVLRRDIPDPDDDTWHKWVVHRALAAARVRTSDPRLAHTDALRLIHGENDHMPGLVVDLYGDAAVAIYDGLGAHGFWSRHMDAVLAGIRTAGFSVQRMWARIGHGRGRGDDSLPGVGLLVGQGQDPARAITVREYDARFEVDMRTGHKTGLFLDQRENRRLVGAFSAGARVLDVCSYTGGFAVHAALGGARSVTVLDSARPAIDAARRNFGHSGLALHGHRFVCADAFEYLRQAAERDERYDLIVLDPPSFAPSERAKPRALDAYRALQRAALSVLEPQSWLMSASCSSHVSTRELMDTLARAVQDTGRRARVLESRGAASDHPVLPCFPEGDYLSFLVVAIE